MVDEKQDFQNFFSERLDFNSESSEVCYIYCGSSWELTFLLNVASCRLGRCSWWLLTRQGKQVEPKH